MPYPHKSFNSLVDAERYFEIMLLNYYEPCIWSKDDKYTTPSGVLKKHFALLYPNTNRQIARQEFHHLISNNIEKAFPALEHRKPSVERTCVMLKCNLLKEIPFDILRSLPPNHPFYVHGSGSKKKKESSAKSLKLCKYYVIGECTSDYCNYSHDASYLPCRTYYLTGSCPSQESCPFSHDRIKEPIPIGTPPSKKRGRHHLDFSPLAKRQRISFSQQSPSLYDEIILSQQNCAENETQDEEQEQQPKTRSKLISNSWSFNTLKSESVSEIETKTKPKSKPKIEVVPDLEPGEKASELNLNIVDTDVTDLNQ